MRILVFSDHSKEKPHGSATRSHLLMPLGIKTHQRSLMDGAGSMAKQAMPHIPRDATYQYRYFAQSGEPMPLSNRLFIVCTAF